MSIIDKDGITIRPMEDSDCADVARIWLEGLEQSKTAVPWWLHGWFMDGMNRNLVAPAISETGDVGPNGCNLMKTYMEPNDRCMMVATYADSSSNSDDESVRVVVGCCAVKVGMDSTKVEPDSKIGSIWRMSVDETCRGKGIATKLMTECETWAKQRNCTSMGLWTVNPVAANFYMKRMNYIKGEEYQIVTNWFAQQVIPPSIQYTKQL